MICTTIQHKTYQEIHDLLNPTPFRSNQAEPYIEMAEIRLDRCELSPSQISRLFTSDTPLVATCRIAETTVQKAQLKLERAIEAGARYVDVEIEAPKTMSKAVRAAAHENGAFFIRSYHDFEGTAGDEELRAMLKTCLYQGADIVKIVTTAHSEADVQRVLSLYDWCAEQYAQWQERGADPREKVLPPTSLIAFCMGEVGRDSRIDCLRKGAPYTYAALTADEAAAPGQWQLSEIAQKIYGTAVADNAVAMPTEQHTMPLRMPCSKSFAQRAIIAAALAEGESVLEGYSPCGDNEAALQVARNIGAEVRVDLASGAESSPSEIEGSSAQTLRIKGISAGVATEEITGLHVGESGLLTRIMMPLVAQISSEPVLLTGEKTLLNRPLKGAEAIMDAFGVITRQIDQEPSSVAQPAEQSTATQPTATQPTATQPSATQPDALKIPLTVHGPLRTGKVQISGKHGSQLVTGLLMASALSGSHTTISVTEPKSIPYMFITLDVLKKFGIRINNEMLGGRDFLNSGGDWALCSELVFKVKPNQKYRAANFVLEGDWSAAANFLVAGAIFGKVELEGLDTKSLQADLSIMDILMEAGASLSETEGQSTGSQGSSPDLHDTSVITAQRAPLNAFHTDATNCPDLFPIIAILAAFCPGTSSIKGASRLIHKESNRAEAIIEMLSQMGVEADIQEDTMYITGESLTSRILNGNLISSGHYTSRHDHRMVMALKVASLGADGPITIDDEACVAKSFPQFHNLFNKLTHNKI